MSEIVAELQRINSTLQQIARSLEHMAYPLHKVNVTERDRPYDEARELANQIKQELWDRKER